MKNYLEQLHYILDKGIIRSDRTGVGTISCFGLQTRYNMQDGIPCNNHPETGLENDVFGTPVVYFRLWKPQ